MMENQPEPFSLELTPDVQTVLAKAYPSKGVEEDKDKTSIHCIGLPCLLQWLANPPMFTTLRINTLVTSLQAAKKLVESQLEEQCSMRKRDRLEVDAHATLSDCLVICNTGPHTSTEKNELEVIVDVQCGMAVLRGADIFKQGILGAPVAMLPGSKVGVMCDLEGKCLRGLTKPYQERKLYVGSGVAHIGREELFRSDPSTLRGVGIQMTEPLYHAPSLSELLPSQIFPQNLPSIVCGHVADPQPGQTVIDMCAAPGGKTCHLAALMKNQGRLVALDKTEDKVNKIKVHASNLSVTCVETYAFDARKAVLESAALEGSPPYPPGSFDVVLLDGPCSALGQRPALRNTLTGKGLASFPKLQRMLLETAVSLVKPGGSLVYSTCTITLEENEDQVAWLLHTFPQLSLVKQDPHLGSYGSPHSTLTAEQQRLVQRFDPSRSSGRTGDCDSDTIGFFIAKFRKEDR